MNSRIVIRNHMQVNSTACWNTWRIFDNLTYKSSCCKSKNQIIIRGRAKFQDIIQSRSSLGGREISHLYQDFCNVLPLQVSECRPEFDLVLSGHIWVNPLSVGRYKLQETSNIRIIISILDRSTQTQVIEKRKTRKERL